jgi:hypothetical protein
MFDHLPFDQTNKSKEGLVRTFILKNLDIPLKVSCTVGNQKKGYYPHLLHFSLIQIKGIILILKRLVVIYSF